MALSRYNKTMKKTTIIASLAITAAFTTLAFVFSSQDPLSDDIISPYIRETVTPLVNEPNEKNFNGTAVFSDLTTHDYVILPDQSILSVGQVYSDRNLYAPGLQRTDLNGGAMWTSFLNPVHLDGVDYSDLGTSFNTFTHVIYVNSGLIYAIGTIQTRLFDTDGNAYPLTGFFADQQIPMGEDQLVFVISFADNFTNLRFHGFLSPVDEEGLQNTIVRGVTLIDANTMVLTGITNSHGGLFASGPSKPVFDFVLSVNVGDTLIFNHLFSFEHEDYVQPTRVYALFNGDLIVSGQFLTSSGDFAEIKFNQDVMAAGFVARINGETFALEWIQSNLLKPIGNPGSTQYLNVLELDTHDLITIANVEEATTEKQSILVSVFKQDGGLRTQKLLNDNAGNLTAKYLMKAETGYWIIGDRTAANNTNLILMKLTSRLTVDFTIEIMGSGLETWLGKPFVTSEASLMVPIGTNSKDQDFAFLEGQPDNYFQMWLSLV